MSISPALLLAAKLALVAASVLLASLVARRFGHAAGGLLAGMPMIAGPITGLLLIDVPSPAVRAVCLATLACQPALMAYFVAYAHAAHWPWRQPARARERAAPQPAPRWPWWACLAFALAVFFALGSALLALPLPEPARIALALLSPMAGAAALPRQAAVAPAQAGAPAAASSWWRLELASRVGVAVAVAAGVMWGAAHLGAGLAGLLLAMPITGMVLPSFTHPRHGPAATVALLAGFVRGQAGFVTFFVVLLLVLPAWPAGPAWLLAMATSGLLPWLWNRTRGPAARAAAARPPRA